MSLEEKYPQEVKKILAKYPPEHKQSAVMPLLHLVQRDQGFVDRRMLREVAAICGLTETDVAEIVGFYTLYHDRPEGRLRIQVCTDLACALRGADEFLAGLCGRLGIQPGDTTPDGCITVEPVMCLAACDKAPLFQVQGPEGIEYHENMTVEGALVYIESVRHSGQEVEE
jgi:NADH-quinone oxidoreductase subunit E